jgi:NADH pyrophosphatase NudC (nudix superfamily)
MSASTSWWFCGVCGFRNHPRQNQDTKKCEQCGASSSEQAAVDYVPKEG